MVLSTNDFLEMNNPLTTTSIQEGSEVTGLTAQRKLTQKHLQAYKAKGETT